VSPQDFWCSVLGGIGGYFGGSSIESGTDVTFLVRGGRRKILSEQVLRIESPFGDAQLAVASLLPRRASRSPTSFGGCGENLEIAGHAGTVSRMKIFIALELGSRAARTSNNCCRYPYQNR